MKDSVFEQMSDTKTPQGILAVAKQLSYKTDDLLGGDSGGETVSSGAGYQSGSGQYVEP